MYYPEDFKPDDLYCQCTLVKKDTTQTSWIPKKFAKKGRFIKLKEDDGWEVISVSKPISGKIVKIRSQDYKKTRKASDI